MNTRRTRRVKKEKVTLKCSDCDFTFVGEGSRKLSQHALNVHQKVLNINPNPKKAQKQRSGCGRAKDYLCESCPYSTAYKFNLTKHVNALHTKEKLYKCHLCDYSAFHSSLLNLHKKKEHCRDLSCKECNFKAKDLKLLVSHIKEAHKETAKVYTCDLCHFSTYHELAMKEHFEKNHEEKICYVCDFVGSSWFALRKHMKAEHRDQQIHKCDLCLYSTELRRNLTAHLKVFHVGVEVDLRCKECGFEAADLKLIEDHAKEAHAEEYPCDQCEFSAHHEPTLVAHVRSMHEKCNLCDFAPKTMGQLRRHMEVKHHIIDPEREDEQKFRDAINGCREIRVINVKFHKSFICNTFAISID